MIGQGRGGMQVKRRVSMSSQGRVVYGRGGEDRVGRVVRGFA